MVAWTEVSENVSMCLLKWFSKSRELEWQKELDIVKALSVNGGHINLVNYRWHSKGMNKTKHRKRKLQQRSLLEVILPFLVIFSFFSEFLSDPRLANRIGLK